MNKGFALLIFLFIYKIDFAQDFTLEDVREFQNIEFTRSILKTLTSPYFEGRDSKRKTIYRTHFYLESILRTHNVKAYFEEYKSKYNLRDTNKGYNLVGLYRGNYRKKSAILIMANYDNLGIIYEKNTYDSMYNGANDNATGVAALLQMAMFFNRVKPKENIVFALTSGKQPSMVGAGFLADEIQKYNFLKISYVINLEMLGRPMTNSDNNIISIQDTTNSLVELMNEYVGEDFVARDTSSENTNRSEHTPMHNVLKVPTATLTSFNFTNDENYMTPYDDMNNVDVEYLHRTINRITFAIYKIIADNRKITYDRTPIPLLKLWEKEIN